jgi:3-dehydroquinate synthase
MIIKCSKYDIPIGELTICNLDKHINFDKYSGVVLLTESKILKLWQKKIKQYFPKNIHIIQIKSGEGVKNIKTATKILEKLINLNLDRKSLLINFGGGMISDLGGFVASVYMRGIDFINIPTTLLSMIDASIGGKNAINMGGIKNIIGNFSNPKLVLIDTSFLETLNQREYTSAFAEIIKHGIIWDSKYFDAVNSNIKITDKVNLIEIIKQSLEIKKYIVEEDFYEHNIRKLLNFGHTIGHAFESISSKTDYPLLHGEAVAIGMIIESEIATKIGKLSKEENLKIKNCILNLGFRDLLKMNFNYYNLNELTDLIIKDKKNENQKIKLVLPNKIGKCEYNVEVSLDIIKDHLKDFLSERS